MSDFTIYAIIIAEVICVTDILLLGTFHFHEENTDFNSDEVQFQLDMFCRRMSKFSPDAVAVELDKTKYGDKVCISDDKWRHTLSSESFSVGGRIADPEKKYTYPQRATIGKVCADDDTRCV